MISIVERLRFDATRCELQFSKGVAANISEAADEIARLQEAKRRALHLADERAKEAVTLRATLLNIQALAEQGNPIDSAKLATRCRHALNQQERKTDGS